MSTVPTSGKLVVRPASVVGARHADAGRNCQDGHHVATRGDRLVAVVTDGCGSSPHSEVGAVMGARIWAQRLARCTLSGPDAIPVVREQVNDAIRSAVDDLVTDAYPLAAAVEDHFLFTVVGVVLDPACSFAFMIGDGFVSRVHEDGRRTHRCPGFPGNAPPYHAYDVMRVPDVQGVPMDAYRPCTHLDVFDEVPEIVVIGTDGAEPLLDGFPSAGTLVTLDTVFGPECWPLHSAAFARRFSLLNRGLPRKDGEGRIVRESRPFADDATVIGIRVGR